jgi:hypothetical protein
MKKILLGLIILFGTLGAKAQVSNNEVTLFAQCMIEISNESDMRTLEAEIRLNPYVKIARLDYNTQRAFILTKNIDQLSEVNFTSWFNQFSDNVRCIQIGTYGVDVVKPYPFEGCDK